MVVVRILALATAIALAVMVLLWLVSGERKWLRRAWRLFKLAVFVVALLLVLFAGERLVSEL